jgi:hypothetical protein
MNLVMLLLEPSSLIGCLPRRRLARIRLTDQADGVS